MPSLAQLQEEEEELSPFDLGPPPQQQGQPPGLPPGQQEELSPFDLGPSPQQQPIAPIPPPFPVPRITQTETPEDFVRREGRKGFIGFVENTIGNIVNVAPSAFQMLGRLAVPWGHPEISQDEGYWKSFIARPAYIDAKLRQWEQQYPNIPKEQLEKEFLDKAGVVPYIAGIFPGWMDMIAHLFSLGQAAGHEISRLSPDIDKELIQEMQRNALENPGRFGGLIWTPMAEEVTQMTAGRWRFDRPEVRQAFKENWQNHTLVTEYLGDLSMFLSLKGAAAKLGARGARTAAGAARGVVPKDVLAGPEFVKQIAREFGLPEGTSLKDLQGFAKHRLNTNQFARRLDQAAGHLDAVNRYINEGGPAPGLHNYLTQQVGRATAHIPGARGISRAIARRTDPETGRFEMQSGLADIIDPELWIIRGTGNVLGRVATGALSPYEADVNKRMMEWVKGFGINPEDIPASILSQAERVSQIEGVAINVDDATVVEKLQTAIRLFQGQVENITEQFGVSGDLDDARRAIESAFDTYEKEFQQWASAYRNQIVPGSENVVADLTPIYQLRQQMEIERQRLHQELPAGAQADEPSMIGFLDDILEQMERYGQSGLTPEAVEAMRSGEAPKTPPDRTAPPTGQVGTVRIENVLGMPHRTASSSDYRHHYNVEYRVIPMGKVVTSHKWDGGENPLFQELAEHLGYTNLQPREYKGDFVRTIARDIQPMGYLADMRILDRGAPIVVEVPDYTRTLPDGTEVTETLYLMLSGNNRAQALEMARNEYPDQYARYRQELENELAHYGYTAEDMQDPDATLLRVLTDNDADLAALVDQGNTAATRLFDAGEQSAKDKEHLNEDILKRLNLNMEGKLGDILQSEENIDVVFEWLQRFTPADRGNMTTTETARTGRAAGSQITVLTEQGVQRLVNALFRRTFDGTYGRKMMELFVTRQDSDIRNIESGIMAALQDVARLEIGTRGEDPSILPEYSIAEDIAQTVVAAWQFIQEGKQEGLGKRASIDRGRAQGELFAGIRRIASDDQQLILDAVAEAVQHPRVLASFIEDYVAAVNTHGRPAGMFAGQIENPPRSVLLEQLHTEYFDDTDQPGTLAESTPMEENEQRQIYWKPEPLRLWYLSQQIATKLQEQRNEQANIEAENILRDVRLPLLQWTQPTIPRLFRPYPRTRPRRIPRHLRGKEITAQIDTAKSPIMKSNRRVSVEWEGFVPTAGLVTLRSYLNTLSYHIGLTYDPSLRTEKKGMEAIELKIDMPNIRKMETVLQDLFDFLNNIGAEINYTAGFHVHVDKRGMTSAEMANIIFSWAKYEYAITRIEGQTNLYSPEVQPFALDVQPDMKYFSKADAQNPKTQDKIARIWELLRHRAGDFTEVAKQLAAFFAAPRTANSIHNYFKDLPEAIQFMNKRRGNFEQAMLDVEQKFRGELQHAMKQGPLAVAKVVPYKRRLHPRGVGDGNQTIEFRQGEATLDFKQAMENVAFALGFVEKYRKKALRPSKRALASDAIKEILKTDEETVPEYYKRIWGDTKWDKSMSGDGTPLRTKLAEWDADPNTAYWNGKEYIKTFYEAIGTLPHNAKNLFVRPGGQWQADGTFNTATTTKPGAKGITIPIPSTFDTSSMEVTGTRFGTPHLEWRVRRLFKAINERIGIPLKGMTIYDPLELAVVAQALRMNMESTLTVFIDGKTSAILGHDITTVDKAPYTGTHAKGTLERLIDGYKKAYPNADIKFLTLHNHPSGTPYFSKPDILSSFADIKNFENHYIGQLIVNSGKFAYEWINRPHKQITDAQYDEWDRDPNIQYLIHALPVSDPDSIGYGQSKSVFDIEAMGGRLVMNIYLRGIPLQQGGGPVLFPTQNSQHPHMERFIDDIDTVRQLWGHPHVASHWEYLRAFIEKQGHAGKKDVRVSVVDISDPTQLRVIEQDAQPANILVEDKKVPLHKSHLGWDPTQTEQQVHGYKFGLSSIAAEDPQFTGAGTSEARIFGEAKPNTPSFDPADIAQRLQLPQNTTTIAILNNWRRLTALLEIDTEKIKKASRFKIRDDLEQLVNIHGGRYIMIFAAPGTWKNAAEIERKFTSKKFTAEYIQQQLGKRPPALLKTLVAGMGATFIHNAIESITVADNNNFMVQAKNIDVLEPDFEIRRELRIVEQDHPEPKTPTKPQQPQQMTMHHKAPQTGTAQAQQMSLRADVTPDTQLKGKARGNREEGTRLAAGKRAQIDLSAAVPPVTYGQIEAWRTYVRREKEKHQPGTPEHSKAARIEGALTQTLERTMEGYNPEVWEKLKEFYRLYHMGAVSIKSKIGKAIRRHSQEGLVEGTGNAAKMVNSLFSPGDTPENIKLMYQLIGGFDSEAGRHVRSVFLENLLENSRPRGAMLELERIREGTTAEREAVQQAQAQLATAQQLKDTNAITRAEVELGDAQKALETKERELQTMPPIDRIQPTGLSGQIEKWLKKTGKGYKRGTIDAILGKQVVDALIDLRDFEQSFSRLKAQARGSRTGPWITRWLDNDLRRGRLVRMIETLALSLSPGAVGAGAVGGIASALAGGNAMVATAFGIAGFISAWLGSAALEVFMNYMKTKPVGRRYLLEGTIVSLDHILTGTPVLASPEQAARHRQTVSAQDYSGASRLWQSTRSGRFLPRADEEEEQPEE